VQCGELGVVVRNEEIMEGCSAPIVECHSLGKAICTINTTIRHPGVEHVSLLFTFVSIFSYSTDCDHNVLVKIFVAPKPPLPLNNGAQDDAKSHELVLLVC
jgi:hypothetical protein